MRIDVKYVSLGWGLSNQQTLGFRVDEGRFVRPLFLTDEARASDHVRFAIDRKMSLSDITRVTDASYEIVNRFLELVDTGYLTEKDFVIDDGRKIVQRMSLVEVQKISEHFQKRSDYAREKTDRGYLYHIDPPVTALEMRRTADDEANISDAARREFTFGRFASDIFYIDSGFLHIRADSGDKYFLPIVEVPRAGDTYKIEQYHVKYATDYSNGLDDIDLVADFDRDATIQQSGAFDKLETVAVFKRSFEDGVGAFDNLRMTLTTPRGKEHRLDFKEVMSAEDDQPKNLWRRDFTDGMQIGDDNPRPIRILDLFEKMGLHDTTVEHEGSGPRKIYHKQATKAGADDDISRAILPHVTDRVDARDRLARATETSKADSGGAFDRLDKLFRAKPFSDRFAIIDRLHILFGKTATDGAGASDRIAGQGVALSKVVVDEVYAQHQLQGHFGDGANDLSGVSDKLDRAWDARISFSDRAGMRDKVILLLERGLSDSAQAADSAKKAFGKVSADSANAGDALAKDSAKTAEDSASADDRPSLMPAKPVQDGFSLSDQLVTHLTHKRYFDDQGRMVGVLVKHKDKAGSDFIDTVEIEGALTGHIGPGEDDVFGAGDRLDRAWSARRGADETMRMTDVLVITFSKVSADSANAGDDLAKGVERGLADSVNVEDEAVKRDHKRVEDRARATEQAAYDAGKPVEDTVRAGDALVRDKGKNTYDRVDASDQLGKAFTTASSDSFQGADTVDGLDVGKTVRDDAAASHHLRGHFGDGADDLSAVSDKLDQSWTAYREQSDTARIGDALVIAFGKVSADSANAGDAVVKDASTRHSDRMISGDRNFSLGFLLGKSDSVEMQEDFGGKDIMPTALDRAGATDDINSFTIGKKFLELNEFRDVVAGHFGPGERDSYGLGDLLTQAWTAYRSLEDRVQTIETVRIVLSRPFDESVNASDELAKGFARGLSDTGATSDQINAKDHKPVKIDRAIAGDVINKHAVSKTVTDVVDAAHHLRGHFGDGADDLSAVADRLDQSWAAYREQSDTARMTDALVIEVERGLEDRVTASDALAKEVERGLVDRANAQDILGGKNIAPEKKEEFILFDSLHRVSQTYRSQTDLVEIEGALTGHIGPGEDDVFGAGDRLDRAWSARRGADETMRMTDVLVIAFDKVSADDVNAGDNLAKDVERGLADSVNVEDEAVKRPLLPIAEPVNASDSIDALNMAKAMADSAEMEDDPTGHIGPGEDDVFGAGERLDQSWTAYREQSDTVNIGDALVTHLTHIRAYSDNMMLTDVLVMDMTKEFVDSVAGHDQLWRYGRKGFADDVNASDALGKGTERGLADSVSADDKAIANASKPVRDGASLGDALNDKTKHKKLTDTGNARERLIGHVGPGEDDAFGANDHLSQAWTARLNPVERVQMRERVRVLLFKGLSERVNASDQPALSPAKGFSDRFSPRDALTKQPQPSKVERVRATDSLAGRDNKKGLRETARMTHTIAGHFGDGSDDSMAMSESLTVSVGYGRRLRERMRMSDSLNVQLIPGKTQDYVDNDDYFAEDYVQS